MGTVAQNTSVLLYFQNVNVPVLYAQKVLYQSHDGLLSVSEPTKNPVFSSMAGNLTLLLTRNITTANVTITQQQLHLKYNTNNDVYISINNELKPKLENEFESFSVVTPYKKCTDIQACPIWIRLCFGTNFEYIGNVPSCIDILILNGKNDTQTPVHQAFLLQ